MKAHLYLLASVGAVALSVPAAAQAEVANAALHDYAISPGAMKTALDAWARQSRRQIIYSASDVDGLRTAGVRGRLAEGAALEAILSRSGLRIHRDASGAVAVVRAQRGAGGATAAAQSASAAQFADVQGDFWVGWNVSFGSDSS